VSRERCGADELFYAPLGLTLTWWACDTGAVATKKIFCSLGDEGGRGVNASRGSARRDTMRRQHDVPHPVCQGVGQLIEEGSHGRVHERRGW
jgi:hypothetical protein